MKFNQSGLDAYKAESRKPVQKDIKKDVSPPGLLKTAAEGNQQSGAAQAARFLLLLGKEEAGRVLKNMSAEEIEQVTLEIAAIKEIHRDEALDILRKFGDKVNLKGEGIGGIDTARDFLSGAFGKEKAEEILNKAIPDAVPPPFSFINDFTLAQILQILKDEPDETCSIILSFLKPEKVSAFIKTRDAASQVKLLRLMAQEREFDPDILSRMDAVLQEKAHRIGRQDEIVIDGKDKLTEILKHMDSSSERRILGDLEDKDPDLSREIKEQLHTIDCIFKMRSRDLQNLLLEMDDDKIAFILRGKEDSVKEHILNHLSSQRKLFVEETMIISPKVSRKDVDKETREFLNIIRKREEEGSYILLGDDEEEYI